MLTMVLSIRPRICEVGHCDRISRPSNFTISGSHQDAQTACQFKMESPGLCSLPVELIEIIAEYLRLTYRAVREFRLVCRELDAKCFHWYASRYLRSLLLNLRPRRLSRLDNLCRRCERAAPYVQHLTFRAERDPLGARIGPPPNRQVPDRGRYYYPSLSSPAIPNRIRTLRDNLANDLVNCHSFSISFIDGETAFLHMEEVFTICFAVIEDSQIPVKSFELLGDMAPNSRLDFPHKELSQISRLSGWSHLEKLALNCPDQERSSGDNWMSLAEPIRNAPNLRVLELDLGNLDTGAAEPLLREISSSESLPSITKLKLAQTKISATGAELIGLLQRLRGSLRVLRFEDFGFASAGACEAVLDCVNHLPILEHIHLFNMYQVKFPDAPLPPVFVFPRLAEDQFTTGSLRRQCRLACVSREPIAYGLKPNPASLVVIGIKCSGHDIAEVLDYLRPVRECNIGEYPPFLKFREVVDRRRPVRALHGKVDYWECSYWERGPFLDML